MWFMYGLSWVSFILIAILLTISVAAGMYYVAELIEEYTTVAKRIIRLLLIIVTSLNILLILFESDFTWTLCLIGLISNVIYFFILSDFPVIGFLSPTFLFSMVLLVIHHYFAFSFFNYHYYPFPEILAYFTIFVWIIPFCFVYHCQQTIMFYLSILSHNEMIQCQIMAVISCRITSKNERKKSDS